MHDQADELRQLVRQSALASAQVSAAPQLVTVAGGKGGVGTTTLAVNLAVALARGGRRIVLVDADLRHASVAQLCQIPEHGSVLDAISGRHTTEELLQLGPAGIQVLPGAWASEEISEISAAAIERFLVEMQRALNHQADVIVIDVGSERDALARRLWHAADQVLLVATPETTSIMEAYAAVKVLHARDTCLQINLLVNLAPDAATATDVQQRICEAGRRFLGLQIGALGYVPFDAAAADAAQSGRPLVEYSPRSKAARAVERVADSLCAQWTPEKKSA